MDCTLPSPRRLTVPFSCLGQSVLGVLGEPVSLPRRFSGRLQRRSAPAASVFCGVFTRWTTGAATYAVYSRTDSITRPAVPGQRGLSLRRAFSVETI